MAIISNGTTIADAGSFASGLVNADQVLIKELTASSSANLTFVHGTSSVVLDSTYPIYVFKYINIHPASVAQLTVNFRDGDSNFDATKTSNTFNPYHNEDGTSGSVSYRTAWDLAQSTSAQIIAQELGNGNDESASGYLHLFEPSNTTFVKHFIGEGSNVHDVGIAMHTFQGGYFNTTSAITGIQFKFASGNIDSGKIKLYGIKDS